MAACANLLQCGHPCPGIKDDVICPPCLYQCQITSRGRLFKQSLRNVPDLCLVCHDHLSSSPVIQLKCGHIFHLNCTRTILQNRWLGPRITFGFTLCPICKTQMEHPELSDLTKPLQALYEDVQRKALTRLRYEGLESSREITFPGQRFYNDPAGFAVDKYAYYLCCKCQKPYYGGGALCHLQTDKDDYNPNELVCAGCSDVTRKQSCSKHGTDFLSYKCRYCCSIGVFYCFGTTHFCDYCHTNHGQMTSTPKDKLPHCPAGPGGVQLEGDHCPLNVKHPPTGDEFCLGCAICANEETF